MRVCDRIRVEATPGEVWAILGDLSYMSLWNPKCVRCEAPERQTHVAVRFKAAFRLSGPERECDCEVIECLPECLLTIQFSGDFSGRGIGYVAESFRLQPSEGGTQVSHTVDFSRSGLPWLLTALLKIMSVVGRPVGKSSLDCLKELVEDPACRPRQGE